MKNTSSGFIQIIGFFIIILVFSMEISDAFFLDDFFSDNLTDNTLIVTENNPDSVPLTPTGRENNREPTFEEGILTASILPEIYENLNELKLNSQNFLIIGDNYTTNIDYGVPAEDTFVPYQWKIIDLNWVESQDPHGIIEIFASFSDPNRKKIVIYPDTNEKGVLLYSSLPISTKETKISFRIKGELGGEDSLVFLVKEVGSPDHRILFSVPDGRYNSVMDIDLSAFSGQKITLIMGAFFESGTGVPWEISLWPQKGAEKTHGKNLQEAQFETVLVPNISMVYPNKIVNNGEPFSILILGEGFTPQSQVSINTPEYSQVYAKDVLFNSQENISAIFSDLNLPSGQYSITISNHDGTLVQKPDVLTIFTPNMPIIQGVRPNTGLNSGIIQVPELLVSNFSFGDEIFLNRSGFNPILGTNTRILENGTLSTIFDLTGEPVGRWNLTVKKPNGKYDTCVDCFTITGQYSEYYTYLYDLEIIIPETQKRPKFESIAIDQSDTIMLGESSLNEIWMVSPEGVLIRKWGGTGDETGNFSFPSSIGLSPSGSIYVVDKANERIQKFNQDGLFLTSWGSNGSEDGFFLNPTGIAFDISGNVYVSDTNNHRIQKFDPDGLFLRKWGSQGGYTGQFNYPTDMVAGYNDTVYVIDSGNDRIQQFDASGRFINAWGTPGLDNGQFISPGSIAVDQEHRIFVTDVSKHQVQKFNSDGSFITKWGSDRNQGSLNCPDGIAVNSSGYLYVVDCINNHIQIFSPTRDDQYYKEPTQEIFFSVPDNYTTVPPETNFFSGIVDNYTQ